MKKPHWERGYKSHGYWIGDDLYIGLVMLPCRSFNSSAIHYTWFLDINIPSGISMSPTTNLAYQCGHSSTLKQAKRAVELAWQRFASIPANLKALKNSSQGT